MGCMTSTAGTASHSTATDGLRLWINGELFADPHSARISPLDHGLVVGDGVFEALKVTPAGAFAVQRHLDRLSRSARALGLPEPDHSLIRTGIETTIEGRDWVDGKIRITYTGGRGPLGSQPAYGPSTIIVAAEPRHPAEPVSTIVTAPWTRNVSGPMTGVKTTSYADNVRGLAYALQRDAAEAIFVNTDGNVCEGTGSNIFFVFGQTVITPPLTAGPLAGITRELLIEWADVTESDLTPEEAARADEVFITSSLRDVQAVRRWDDRDYPAVGPRTSALARLFAERSAELVDP
jgi:branched-chain amino acid aminotransferase